MGPNIIKSIFPGHCQENILADTEITVSFLEPMLESSINLSNISLLKNDDYSKVDITVSYDAVNYILSISPVSNLEPLTTYHVILRGESEVAEDVSEVDEGIKSAVGSSLFGDYDWTFTTGNYTVLLQPDLIYPSDKVSFIQTPSFNWSAVANAVTYDIVISTSSLFDEVMYNGNISGTEMNLPFSLAEPEEYWWKVRAVSSSGVIGPWSCVRSFIKGDVSIGVVSAFDTEPAVQFLETLNSSDITEVVNVFPPNGESAVGVNLPYIAVQLKGYVPARLINSDTIKLIGEPYTKKSSILEDQSWWINSPIASPVMFTESGNVADKMRAIKTHGQVNLKYVTVYDSTTNTTTVIGAIEDFNSDKTDTNFFDSTTEAYSRESLIGDQDGVNTEFYTPSIPVNGSLKIYVNGLLFNLVNISSNKVTFLTPPAKSDVIEAIYLTGYNITEIPAGAFDGSNTIYSLKYNATNLKLYNSDLKEYNPVTDYTYAGKAITMTVPTATLIARYEVYVPCVVNETPDGTCDGVNAVFTLDNVPYKNSEQIYINGVQVYRGVAYTINNETITFITPPLSSDVILCEYFITNPCITGEVPSGAVNGTNKIFTLSNVPVNQTVELSVNGILINKSNYIVNGSNITINNAPVSGANVRVKYQVSGKIELPIPASNSVNHLLPNNRYYIICTLSNLKTKYVSSFTSQYWPLFANIEDVKLDLSGVNDLTDDQLYASIRDTSIQSTHMQTSAMHYLIETTMTMYENDGYDLPFDPNSPTYPIYMYVRYKTAYMILLRLMSQTALNGAGRKKLGDLEISKGSLPIMLQPFLDEIKTNLKLWEDAVKGHHGRGDAYMRYGVRGSNASNQYSNDYPLRTRLLSPGNADIEAWWRTSL